MYGFSQSYGNLDSRLSAVGLGTLTRSGLGKQ